MCPNGCSNRGNCINGTCSCDAGYTGVDCSLHSCPDDCSGNGLCYNGKCYCNGGYSGDACEESCSGIEGNECSGRGKCFNNTCWCASVACPRLFLIN